MKNPAEGRLGAGPARLEDARFFAALRMTIEVKLSMDRYTSRQRKGSCGIFRSCR
jgi:hypothetical protein